MKKKKMHPVLKILLVLFVLYTGLYIMDEAGYYEKSMKDKVFTTKEQIEKFEKDIKDNKNVESQSYLPKTKDYSNVFTKSALAVSKKLNKILTNSSKNAFDFLKTLFLP